MSEARPPPDLGPLQPLIDDPAVSEIMINGPDKVFVERNGCKSLSNVRFAGEAEIKAVLERIFAPRGKRLDTDVPYADACLEDGTRVNAIVAPVSRFGLAVTLRKFSNAIRRLDDLVALGTLNAKAAEFLIACVKGKINVLFSGGTGVGKTTLLQMLSAHFAPDERVITIEDAAELQLAQSNVISLETRTPDPDGRGEVTLRDLLRNSLRMAPDRLIIGEVRGAEAIELIQAMATGHSGTLGVIHGNSPRDVIARLETMILSAGLSLPLAEARKAIASTIALVVHMDRMPDGARRVTAITELRGLDGGEIVFNDLFLFKQEGDGLEKPAAGALRPVMHYYPRFFQKLQKRGLLSDSVFAETN